MINAFDDILNYLGAFMRWGAGIVFEIVFGIKNLTFDEVLHGPENKSESLRGFGHRNANRFFALIIISALVVGTLAELGLF